MVHYMWEWAGWTLAAGTALAFAPVWDAYRLAKPGACGKGLISSPPRPATFMNWNETSSWCCCGESSTTPSPFASSSYSEPVSDYESARAKCEKAGLLTHLLIKGQFRVCADPARCREISKSPRIQPDHLRQLPHEWRSKTNTTVPFAVRHTGRELPPYL